MATNFVQPGNALTLTAPSGGVTKGLTYKIGSVLCVAQVTAAEGDPFVAEVVGVHQLIKVTAQAWTVGAKVYWDDSGKKWTTSSGGNTLGGVAVAAAANPSTTGKVRLDGMAR